MNEPSYTVDEDTDRRAWDPPKWKVTKRDADGMPVDEYGPYDSKAKAARSAANRRYSAKTRRPVQPR